MSQNGEDYLLDRVFGGSSTGFYVDVGAFDGIHLSNTYALDQRGWDGICIEPVAATFRLLTLNRPRAVCLQFAISKTASDTDITVDATGLLSSLSPAEGVVAAGQKAVAVRGLASDRASVHAEPVLTCTLDDVLRKFSPPRRLDVLSIDVEGWELAVLEGFSMTVHSPRVLLLEANDSDVRSRIRNSMEEWGYQLGRSLGVNDFFSNEPELVSRLRETPIIVSVPANLHPSGPQLTHPTLREPRVIFGGRSVAVQEAAKHFFDCVDREANERSEDDQP